MTCSRSLDFEVISLFDFEFILILSFLCKRS